MSLRNVARRDSTALITQPNHAMKLSRSFSPRFLVSGHLPAAFAWVAVMLVPLTVRGDEINLNLSVDDTAFPNTSQSFSQTSGGGLSSTIAGPNGNGTANANYGSINIQVHGSNPDYFDAGDAGASAYWLDTYTINNSQLTGTQGTARFTFHVSGSMLAPGNSNGVVDWSVHGEASTSGPLFNYSDGYQGIQPSNYSTFTGDVGFTFGTPFTLKGSASGSAEGYPGTSDVNVSLTSGGYQVLSGSNQVNYTGSSKTGSSAGSTVLSGNSFAGFSVTDTGFGSHATILSILGGTASADRNITGSFVAAPAGSTGKIIGDVIDLSGFGSTPGQATDTFVTKLSYDPSAALGQFGSANGLGLDWYDPNSNSWRLATDGDFGGTPFFAGNGAYDPLTDFHLGYYGVDTTDDYAWAVVNHNSQFAVGSLVSVPEPSRALLLLVGVLGCVMRRRRWSSRKE
jgi:hypothetical protein